MIPKFRAWHKKEKRMYYNPPLSWWDGTGIGVDEYFELISKKTVQHGSGQCIVMQSTGLKDKNGKEIFEGDIIKYRCKIGMKETSNAEVKRVKNKETGMMEFKFYDKYGDFELGKFWVNETSLEVIGNIHDNPELLRGKK